ncbi:hypothetical protein Goklo_027946 [Gossypium klotzschianum]|uniref:Aminotransferase-like plant mobile domain-containing protein n=1 Tax=Gossypium klotzschianum TaxID=34286 RepID=A0A7J8TZV2_9ROSI|nr:hypothetical protein [Gossypium klotzschianum]
MPSPLIEPYLREAGFWHTILVGQGCKLDPKLISTLVKRWRPEMHTFYLPCDKCTITLDDVYLQLGLPIDGSVVTRSVQSTDWGAVCGDLLGLAKETIYGGRIKMAWIRKIFVGLDEDSTEVKRERHTQTYIIQIIGCILKSDKSLNLVHLR